MINITDLLKIIRAAIFGRDMRQAIHDSLETLESAANTLNNTAEKKANKGAPNGYASLDENGQLLRSQAPPLVITDTFPVDSEAEMLALKDAEKGDIAIRTDIPATFILKAEPYSVLANWQELLTPTDLVLSVGGKQGHITMADLNLNYVDNTRDIDKNVLSAIKLAVARKINGVDFDGTSDITITDDTKEPKLPAGGDNTHFLRGDKTWQSISSAVLNTVLTGLSLAAGGVISAADSVLIALGKLQNQVSNKQDKLQSGTSIKTLNGTSLLGSGDIVMTVADDSTLQAILAQLQQAIRDANDALFIVTGKVTQGQVDDSIGAHNSDTTAHGNILSAIDSKAPANHASSAATYGLGSATNYGHVKAATANPKAPGTANPGTDNGEYAGGDHVHPAQVNITGNAGTAGKLQTPVTINGVPFDGSSSITLPDQGGGFGGSSFTELDDMAIQSGRVATTSTGAAFRQFTFPVPFDTVPNVVAVCEAADTFIFVANVTAVGFQYMVKRFVAGSVSTENRYFPDGAASTSIHSLASVVTAVTLPTLNTSTTGYYFNYVAVAKSN